MIHTAEVYMWGTRVAILHQGEDSPYVSFEYDRKFVPSGIQLSPIRMPLANRVYEFPALAGTAFHGVPGLIADSLPDRFGNAVISQWLASRGMTEAEFSVIDRLCYTGRRGMGALEYVPAQGPVSEIDEPINVAEMVAFASEVLNQRKDIRLSMTDSVTYSQLLQLGTSAGGARAKAIIAWNPKTNEIRSGQLCPGPEYEHWLMKFDGVNRNGDHGLADAPEYTRIEYAYYRMARAAGIEMNECRIFSENGHHHFMTKRFDRVKGKKIHMQTLGAIAHIDYNVPGLCSYEQAAGYMRQMGLGAGDMEQLYRRMAFNVLAVNQDDHVKNLSFLMDRAGRWRLAPAYDVTFSYDPANRWLSAHQMTVHGKKQGITFQDILAAGRGMDISTQRCRRILEEVRTAVGGWMEIAAETGIRENTAVRIRDIMRKEAGGS